MNVFARPLPTKLAAAVVAVGVASTGAVVALPDERVTPVVTAEVTPASSVTDFLYGIGDLAAEVSAGLGWAGSAAVSFPFDLTSAGLIALRESSLAPSLFSWLTQTYLNPTWSDSYANGILVDSVLPLAERVLGESLTGTLTELAVRFGLALTEQLPSPAAGAAAIGHFWGSNDLGKVILSANYALLAPVSVAWNAAYYLGYLPGDLEATLEAALQDPMEIPGLLSNLAYGLLSSGGLLGWVIDDVIAPLAVLPGPLGALGTDIQDALYAGIDDLLSLLPEPVEPTPFPTPAKQVPADDEGDEESEALVAARSATETEATDVEASGLDSADVESDADDDAAAPSSKGAARVKPGNKFTPGGAGAPVTGAVGGDQAPEAEDSGDAAADANPDGSADEGAGGSADADSSESGDD